jgi:hypothetical protein
MVPPTVPLRDFAGSEPGGLRTKAQAEAVIRAIQSHPRRHIALDFSGITRVSWEFTQEFMRLAQDELPETWLTPRHYDQNSVMLIAPLISRLARMREEAWIKGCDRISGTPSTKNMS